MMRSLYSGISGLKNHQIRMDVIGNNIANVNTIGYKTSRVTFQDIFSQTIANATAPTATFGGTNAKQIGLGITVATIDVMHLNAARQGTDNPTDLTIEGDGFFAVKNAAGLLQYTRVGNIYVDDAGNLVTSGGNFLMGVQGTKYLVMVDDGAGNAINPPEIQIAVDDEGNRVPAGMDTTDTTFYDDEGNLLPQFEMVEGPWPLTTFNLKPMYTDPSREDYAGPVDFDAGPVTTDMFGESILQSALVPMNVSGYLGRNFDSSGAIYGLDQDTGEKTLIGYLCLTNFSNPTGLESAGNSQYAVSSNSGQPVFCLPKTLGTGALSSGGLEMSNVDLAAEFTEMIVTQRGFQANSRIITTTDTLLEELVNLKR